VREHQGELCHECMRAHVRARVDSFTRTRMRNINSAPRCRVQAALLGQTRAAAPKNVRLRSTLSNVNTTAASLTQQLPPSPFSLLFPRARRFSCCCMTYHEFFLGGIELEFRNTSHHNTSRYYLQIPFETNLSIESDNRKRYCYQQSIAWYVMSLILLAMCHRAHVTGCRSVSSTHTTHITTQARTFSRIKM
jgi:hypothetical protein